MPDRKKGILYSHIPKTAGTSFRKAAERHALKWRIYADYGFDNPVTSAIIRECYAGDNFSIVEKLSTDKTLLAGHFRINKYLEYYPLYNVVTFVRDPVQRVISLYYDLQKRIGYSGSLEEFISEPRYRNNQSHFFDKVPVEAVGFIGICEHYQESINLIKKIYDLRIPVEEHNQNENKQDDLYCPEKKIVRLARTMNRRDCRLYEKALNLFETRQQLTKNGCSFVYGKVRAIKDNVISGWAFEPVSRHPVELEISINGHKVVTLAADRPIQRFSELDIGRRQDVGFRYKADYDIQDADVVEVRVSDSQQLLK